MRSGSSAAAAPATTRPPSASSRRPGEQVAEEGVEDAADRALDLLVGELVLADHPGDEPRPDHDQRDREHRPGGGDRRAPRAGRRRAGRAPATTEAISASSASSGATIPSTRILSATDEGLLREVLAPELGQLDVDLLGDLGRASSGVHRSQREADDLDAVGEVERDVALVAHEEQPVGLAAPPRRKTSRNWRVSTTVSTTDSSSGRAATRSADPRSTSWTTISVATTSRTSSSASASAA